MRALFLLGAGFLVASPLAASAAQDISPVIAGSETVIAQEEPPEVVIVTSRFREEDVQAVPVAVSVIGAQKLEDTGSYNVGLLAQLTPTVQFFSSNPRNTAITIRGLGTSFGLTNDGLEAGVGLYIDQV